MIRITCTHALVKHIFCKIFWMDKPESDDLYNVCVCTCQASFSVLFIPVIRSDAEGIPANLFLNTVKA